MDSALEFLRQDILEKKTLCVNGREVGAVTLQLSKPSLNAVLMVTNNLCKGTVQYHAATVY